MIIRSGARGAYVATREHGGHWIDAYWRSDEEHNVIDVTGAGNSFLGGLAAGLALNGSNIIDGEHSRNSFPTTKHLHPSCVLRHRVRFIHH